jgi:hypothetical protein
MRKDAIPARAAYDDDLMFVAELIVNHHWTMITNAAALTHDQRSAVAWGACQDGSSMGAMTRVSMQPEL